MSTDNDASQTANAEVDRLVAELGRAEAYEQRLRQVIIDARNLLASGRVERALSSLNEALNYIDDQTDVVTPHPKP